MSLIETLKRANAAYRAGTPVLSDAEYDQMVEDLREQEPEHPFLHAVEPEPEDAFSGAEVAHEQPMLSTGKAFSVEELGRFFARVEAMARQMGVPGDAVEYTATAKLDGLAGRLYHRHPAFPEGPVLATRGNGLQGTDITRALARGLKMEGTGVSGDFIDGEIVLDEEYFQDVLKPVGFRHARNFMVGFVGADTLREHHLPLAGNGKARFVAYETLPEIKGPADFFLEDIDRISATLRDCPYATDGIVIAVGNEQIREAMGATGHHHRWQIAYKTQAESAETRVLDITWQTGRTGRVTPVIEVEPVALSGATVRRATAHTAKMVERLGIGAGSRVTLVRSGEVIPKIVEVLERAETQAPECCPSCGHALEEDGEYLVCPGLSCKAQAAGRIQHFFRTLGNADGFGPKACERLADAGVTKVSQVFDLTDDGLAAFGFGPGQAVNLIAEMRRCIEKPVEDWRFLAAFGIRHLGRGDSRHLLESLSWMDLAGIAWERIAQVDGFAEKTARSIAADLAENWTEIEDAMHRGLGFTLVPSTRDARQEDGGNALPLAGLSLVFTGTFAAGREILEQEARDLGAQVQSSVNGKTTAVVAGDKPGNSKISKAKALGTPLWSEAEYRKAAKGGVALAAENVENPQKQPQEDILDLF